MADPIIKLVDIRKSYRMGDITQHVLQGVSLSIYPGEYVCIMGPSGCGKSTLLNVLGCLDQPTSGDYFLGGQNVAHLDDDDLSAARNRNLGFIFQSYNLIQQLSVIENIAVPMYYGGAKDADMIEVATRLATQVGLEHRLYHKPTELSGGKQQRVAIARALSNNPLMILADEATGNLDSKSDRRHQRAIHPRRNPARTRRSRVLASQTQADAPTDDQLEARRLRTIQLAHIECILGCLLCDGHLWRTLSKTTRT